MSSTTKPFQVTSGVFMERRGAGWNDERRFFQEAPRMLCNVQGDDLSVRFGDRGDDGPRASLR